MKVSVIIPAFNEEASLPRTLEAILSQDHPDFEVIVVDNASTDRTFETAVSFQGVTVVREGRAGTMWACERGRSEAKGEIIVRLDADCIPETDWLSKGSARFSDQTVVVVSGPYDYYDDTSSFRGLALLIQRNLFYLVHMLFQLLKLGGITMGGNTFMRSTALHFAGGFNTAITFYGDDTDIPKRLSRYGRCIYDRNLIMKTSARRFKKDGIIRLQARYTRYFFKTIFSRTSGPS
ncbi:MAG: glycosyl transferase family 2 [Candidatus Parcubacteria bacterium]|nr:glycosyl transferase family 2 [Candidatus Parcubacteria bacterium]